MPLSLRRKRDRAVTWSRQEQAHKEKMWDVLSQDEPYTLAFEVIWKEDDSVRYAGIWEVSKETKDLMFNGTFKK